MDLIEHYVELGIVIVSPDNQVKEDYLDIVLLATIKDFVWIKVQSKITMVPLPRLSQVLDEDFDIY